MLIHSPIRIQSLVFLLFSVLGVPSSWPLDAGASADFSRFTPPLAESRTAGRQDILQELQHAQCPSRPLAYSMSFKTFTIIAIFQNLRHAQCPSRPSISSPSFKTFDILTILQDFGVPTTLQDLWHAQHPPRPSACSINIPPPAHAHVLHVDIVVRRHDCPVSLSVLSVLTLIIYNLPLVGLSAAEAKPCHDRTRYTTPSMTTCLDDRNDSGERGLTMQVVVVR